MCARVTWLTCIADAAHHKRTRYMHTISFISTRSTKTREIQLEINQHDLWNISGAVRMF